MKKRNIILGSILAIVIILMAWYISGRQSDDIVNESGMVNNTNQDEITTNINSNFVSNTNEVMSDQEIVKKTPGQYMDYSSSAYAEKVGMKRVIFFHATWCPTCKVANQAFTDRTDDIPEDVVIFKTDYDSEKELKAKYGITYQHTYVQVDENGNEITKWNGGDIDELIRKVR